VEEEDAKRPHREREFLVQERVRSENRIAASLATRSSAFTSAGVIA
jgi:transposase